MSKFDEQFDKFFDMVSRVTLGLFALAGTLMVLLVAAQVFAGLWVWDNKDTLILEPVEAVTEAVRKHGEKE